MRRNTAEMPVQEHLVDLVNLLNKIIFHPAKKSTV